MCVVIVGYEVFWIHSGVCVVLRGTQIHKSSTTNTVVIQDVEVEVEKKKKLLFFILTFYFTLQLLNQNNTNDSRQFRLLCVILNFFLVLYLLLFLFYLFSPHSHIKTHLNSTWILFVCFSNVNSYSPKWKAFRLVESMLLYCSCYYSYRRRHLCDYLFVQIELWKRDTKKQKLY